ncbi:MAG: HEPN domain-containing protein [bacterium]
MRDRDDVLTVVREWIAKAENDLKNATHTLKMGRECPTDTVCFHAQQTVEKYLKALLVHEGIDFPKTHDLENLTNLLSPRIRPGLTAEEQARLTDYATGARYPGWSDIPLTEAREAVRLARRVRQEVRASLLGKDSRRKR